MNSINITVPSPGESITTVVIATWLVLDGEAVERDQEIAEIDSDKATLSISAPESGVIKILVPAGDQAGVGEVIATLDTAAAKDVVTPKKQQPPAPETTEKSHPEAESYTATEPVKPNPEKSVAPNLPFTPLAKAFLEKEGITEEHVLELLSQNRLRKADVEKIVQVGLVSDDAAANHTADKVRGEEREKLTPLRQKLSQRLVSVKNETAMLTTFNEVDVSELQRVREMYGKQFMEQHGVKLGLMAFFTMAATRALLEFPRVNASIDGDEMVYHQYTDISIAVSSPKGLLVPVVRNTHTLTLAGIEQEIRRLATKANDNRLTLEEMSGGTFTITNGGVFGSMLSTPILNPPQSAILGMHNIVDRPVAINGRVEIRPIMYVALSYDHRIVDGRESVGFLMRIKELIESPHLLVISKDPYESLLGV